MPRATERRILMKARLIRFVQLNQPPLKIIADNILGINFQVYIYSVERKTKKQEGSNNIFGTYVLAEIFQTDFKELKILHFTVNIWQIETKNFASDSFWEYFWLLLWDKISALIFIDSFHVKNRRICIRTCNFPVKAMESIRIKCPQPCCRMLMYNVIKCSLKLITRQI